MQSAFPIPAIAENGNLHDVLKGERFLEMLPLIYWLRARCAENAYEGPPLRACLMFDDPNLHWPRYGFVDFGQVAAHAALMNYHVSFATIPLDAWFTHSATAELFRTQTDRLSLLVHGNNHTKRELARRYPKSACQAFLGQAIHRIEHLERKAGVRVSRVMVPPHGACSDEVLAELPKCGFEAACVSHGSLRAHNRDRDWTNSLGYLPVELIRGCPVLPRWGFTANLLNDVCLAAFLQQALVFRGHHADLKQGPEILDQVANIINGLGNVRWCNPTELNRSSFQWRKDGGTLRLKPLTSRLQLELPKDAARIVIEAPASPAWDHWRVSHPEGLAMSVCVGEDVPLPEGLEGQVSLESSHAWRVPITNGATWRPVAFGRRLITEGRDRLLSW
jgi:hypothetical protein